jgi:hypothetical protein
MTARRTRTMMGLGFDAWRRGLEASAVGATPEAATSRVLTHYRRKVRANLRRLKKR